MYTFNFNTSATLSTDLSAHAPEPEPILEGEDPIDQNSDGFKPYDPTYWEEITNDLLGKEAPGLGYEPPQPHPETENFLYGGVEDNHWFNKEQGVSAEDAITAYYGGGGIDTVDYSRADGAVGISLKLGIGLVGEAAGDTFYSIENIVGSDFDDVIVGSDNLIGNVLDGGNGADIIHGEAGDDIIRGGNGHDDMFGGQGVDTFEWTHYGGNYIGADRIHDFDAATELLRFRFDNPATASFEIEETEFEGATGLMVIVNEEQNNGPFTRYDVFLDNVAAEDFSAANIEFY